MDAPTKPTESKKGFFKLVRDSIKDTWKNHKKTAAVGLGLAILFFPTMGGASLGIWAACVGLKTAYDVGSERSRFFSFL